MNSVIEMTDVRTKVQVELSPSEKLLWSGKPRAGLTLWPSNGIPIPFGMLWFGLAILWEGVAVSSGASFFVILAGLPPVAIGLYLAVGRFFIAAWQRSKTVDALTDKRAIIVSDWPNHNVRSVNLKATSEISLKCKADGSGTIVFDPNLHMQTWSKGNSHGTRRIVPPGFVLIDDAAQVYQLIKNAQQA